MLCTRTPLTFGLAVIEQPLRDGARRSVTWEVYVMRDEIAARGGDRSTAEANEGARRQEGVKKSRPAKAHALAGQGGTHHQWVAIEVQHSQSRLGRRM